MTSTARFVAVVASGLWVAASVAGPARAQVVGEPPAAPPAQSVPPQPTPPPLAPLPPAPVLLEQVMRGFLEAAPGRESLDEVMRRAVVRNRAAQAAVEAAQRKQFIRQQAQQFEQMLEPLVNTELAFVRRACGSLSPEARREVTAASRKAVREVAEELARVQFAGGGGPAVVEVREAIHARVSPAVAARAAPEEFAAYERDVRQRQERRAEASRLKIVATLDEHLGLTAAQRLAMLEDLRVNWKSAWIRGLEERDGVTINEYPPAPDFADASIAPHLDPAQLEQWRQWSAAASWDSLSHPVIDWGELNALQMGKPNADDWWTQ